MRESCMLGSCHEQQDRDDNTTSRWPETLGAVIRNGTVGFEEPGAVHRIFFLGFIVWRREGPKPSLTSSICALFDEQCPR